MLELVELLVLVQYHRTKVDEQPNPIENHIDNPKNMKSEKQKLEYRNSQKWDIEVPFQETSYETSLEDICNQV